MVVESRLLAYALCLVAGGVLFSYGVGLVERANPLPDADLAFRYLTSIEVGLVLEVVGLGGVLFHAVRDLVMVQDVAFAGFLVCVMPLLELVGFPFDFYVMFVMLPMLGVYGGWVVLRRRHVSTLVAR